MSEFSDGGTDGLAIQSIWDSARVAFSSAVRTFPIWILAGVLTFFAVGQIASSTAGEANATAELGLTGQVVWPFFNVVLSETEARAVDAESAVSDALGDALISYEVRRPDNIGLVVIGVSATTEAEALRGVALATELIVAKDLTEVNARLDDEIVAQRNGEAAASEELAEVLGRIEETTDRFVPGLGEGARRLLDQQIQALNAERDSAQRSQLRAQERLRELAIEVETSQGQVEVSNVLSASAAVKSTGALQFAAAIGAALAAALVLNVFAREQGRILDPAHVRSVMGLPAVHFPDTPTSAVALARLLYALRESEGSRVIGVAAIPTGADSAHEMSLALKSIGEDVVVTEFGFEASSETTGLAFSVLDPFDATTIDAQMACDTAIVVVWEKNTKLWDLRRKIAQLEERGLPVAGVLLRRA